MEKAGSAGKAADDISGILDCIRYLIAVLRGDGKCENDNKWQE
jgi:hypothetical protein